MTCNARSKRNSRLDSRASLRKGFVLALLLCPLTILQAQDAPSPQIEETDLQRSVELINQVEQLESLVENMQSELGTYNTELLQPLDALAQIYIEAQDYNTATQLLDHQLQIHRINNGLHAEQQIPILESLLQMQAQAGDWNSVNSSLGNLTWLYQRNTTLATETQLQGLQMLGRWQLRALEKDVRERQAFHLVELTKLEERTTEIAQRHFGDDNPALSPYLYNQALADIYIALAITLTSDTSQDLMLLTEGIRNRSSTISSSIPMRSVADVEAMYGSKTSTVIERSFSKNMSDGIAKIERIIDIYELNGNLEAEAMTHMYLGDSNLIRQQFENRPSNFAGVRRGSSIVGSAMTHYREALSGLSDAGVSAETIAALTRCPVMLPIPQLHTSAQAAIPVCEQSSESALINLGEYNLVSTLIPGLEGEAVDSDEVITARVKFSVRTNGQVSNDNIEEIEPDDTASRVQIRKLLDIMQFRPAIDGGDAVRSQDMQLLIRIPQAN